MEKLPVIFHELNIYRKKRKQKIQETDENDIENK